MKFDIIVLLGSCPKWYLYFCYNLEAIYQCSKNRRWFK